MKSAAPTLKAAYKKAYGEIERALEEIAYDEGVIISMALLDIGQYVDSLEAPPAAERTALKELKALKEQIENFALIDDAERRYASNFREAVLGAIQWRIDAASASEGTKSE